MSFIFSSSARSPLIRASFANSVICSMYSVGLYFVGKNTILRCFGIFLKKLPGYDMSSAPTVPPITIATDPGSKNPLSCSITI